MTHKRTAQYGKYCRLNTKQPANKSYKGGVLRKQVFLAFALTSSCRRETNTIGLFSKRKHISCQAFHNAPFIYEKSKVLRH